MKNKQHSCVKSKNKTILGIMLLVLSIVLFSTSTISLSWALSSAKKDQNIDNLQPNSADESSESDSGQNSSQDNNEQNDIQDSSAQEGTEDNSGDNNTAGSIKLNASDLYENESDSEKTDAKTNKQTKGEASKSKSNKQEKKNSKTTTYHTAYWKEPIYKTVKHYKAKQKMKTTNDKTTIEWISCKTCGKNHKSSYSETVLDHYIKHYCEICGKKHTQGYYE